MNPNETGMLLIAGAESADVVQHASKHITEALFIVEHRRIAG